jgi:hypothetical protein
MSDSLDQYATKELLVPVLKYYLKRKEKQGAAVVHPDEAAAAMFILPQ